MNLNLELKYNNFNHNEALDGGALYLFNLLKENNNIPMYHMKLENNTFFKNHARNFGGALYIDFDKFDLLSIKNNEIFNNNADIMGGGLFSFNLNKTFNSNDMYIYNNTANSLNNDYSSKPSLILLQTELTEKNLNITSGKHLPLLFYLYDEYGNFINDISNFYSDISIKIVLEEVNDENNIEKEYLNLFGNECTFINGNYFQK